jgi:hypothetical protein
MPKQRSDMTPYRILENLVIAIIAAIGFYFWGGHGKFSVPVFLFLVAVVFAFLMLIGLSKRAPPSQR